MGLTIISVAAIAIAGCQQYEETRREAIKAGLVEDVIGTRSVWVRPK